MGDADPFARHPRRRGLHRADYLPDPAPLLMSAVARRPPSSSRYCASGVAASADSSATPGRWNRVVQSPSIATAGTAWIHRAGDGDRRMTCHLLARYEPHPEEAFGIL